MIYKHSAYMIRLDPLAFGRSVKRRKRRLGRLDNMRHSPFYNAGSFMQHSTVDDLDDELDDHYVEEDVDESADEDDEKDLLLAGSAVIKDPPTTVWTRRDMLAAAVVAGACGAARAGETLASWTLLRDRSSAHLISAMVLWAATKWMLSRSLLLITRQAPLRFGR